MYNNIIKLWILITLFNVFLLAPMVVSGQNLVQSRELPFDIQQFCISPDGKYLFAGANYADLNRYGYVMDSQNLDIIVEENGVVQSNATYKISENGKTIVLGGMGYTVRFFDFPSLNLIFNFNTTKYPAPRFCGVADARLLDISWDGMKALAWDFCDGKHHYISAEKQAEFAVFDTYPTPPPSFFLKNGYAIG